MTATPRGVELASGARPRPPRRGAPQLRHRRAAGPAPHETGPIFEEAIGDLYGELDDTGCDWRGPRSSSDGRSWVRDNENWRHPHDRRRSTCSAPCGSPIGGSLGAHLTSGAIAEMDGDLDRAGEAYTAEHHDIAMRMGKHKRSKARSSVSWPGVAIAQGDLGEITEPNSAKRSKSSNTKPATSTASRRTSATSHRSKMLAGDIPAARALAIEAIPRGRRRRRRVGAQRSAAAAGSRAWLEEGSPPRRPPGGGGDRVGRREPARSARRPANRGGAVLGARSHRCLSPSTTRTQPKDAGPACSRRPAPFSRTRRRTDRHRDA